MPPWAVGRQPAVGLLCMLCGVYVVAIAFAHCGALACAYALVTEYRRRNGGGPGDEGEDIFGDE